MDHANEEETYVIPLGSGTSIVVFGVTPRHRPALEGNFGYLLVSNGVPIGYGGVSPLFRQANTGISLFHEYRHSEARFLFVQALRSFHALFASERFIVNPYQFGAQNDDALATGAFWFYYRLGFRPVDSEVRALARKETAAIQRHKKRRGDRTTLKALAQCDLVYRLPGSSASGYFPEHWIIVCSQGATAALARQGAPSRTQATRRLRSSIADSIGMRSIESWNRSQREALDRMAPLLMLIDGLKSWPKRDKQSLVRLIRAQGATHSRDYCLRLRAHSALQKSLAAYCRRAADGRQAIASQ